jgi:hypothetical protein
MRTELFGILGRALDPQNLQAESTSAAIEALTKPRNRFETMTPEQRAMMRGYYQRNIAIEQGKCPRPKGSSPLPWMLDEWHSDLNQLERVMKGYGEI